MKLIRVDRQVREG